MTIMELHQSEIGPGESGPATTEREVQALRLRVAELERQLAGRPAAAPGAPPSDDFTDSLMLRAMLDELPDHLYFKDLQSRFLRISKPHAAKFGLSDPAAVTGKTDFDFFKIEHAQQAFDDEQEIIRTGQPKINIVEKETWPDGRVTYVSTTKLALRNETGEIIGTFGLTRDITAMKELEQALTAERRLLRTLIDCLPEYIYVKDPEGRYIANNVAFLSLAGVEKQDDIMGKTVFDIYPLELAEKFAAADRQVVETGRPFIDTAERRTLPDGTERYLLVTKAPLIDSDGVTIGLVGVSHDVTELNQAHAKLEKYAAELDEANVELKKFTYIVSHDLRAPLVNLKGFSMELRSALDVIREILAASIDNFPGEMREVLSRALNEDVPEALEFINTSVSRMDGFINALLLLSRLGHRELRPEAIDSNDLVATTLKTLAHQIDQRLIEVETGDLPDVVADKTSMEQIWANLLNNAIVYMMPGRSGRIEISGERLEEETVFRVRDNGRGIRAEDMEKVFAPFRRAGKTDVPGEGMGLSYVQTLVRRHGGNIRCESEDGAGTVFTFTIRHEAPQKGN